MSADYLTESRNALAILSHCYDGHPDRATEVARLVANDGQFTSAMQSLALVLLGVIDQTADLTGITVNALLGQIRTQFALADGIKIEPGTP